MIMPEDMLVRLPEYVSPKIFDRGLDYIRNDFIEPPERVSEHKWVTRAMGRRVYEVSLTFNPQGDDEWHCDCPFDGPVCKHVVAACFAVLQVAGDKYPEYRDFEDMDMLSDQLMDQTDWLLDLSKKHREENRPEEALLIAKAILEEVPVTLGELVEDGNDYYGLPDAGGLMESAAEELCKIAESGNEELKNNLFDSIRNMFPDEELHIGDVPDHLLRAMGLSATDASRVERYLQLLDRLTGEFRNGEQSFIGEHQVQEIKIGYLQQIGRGKEAVEVMLSMKDDPKFCLMLVRYFQTV